MLIFTCLFKAAAQLDARQLGRSAEVKPKGKFHRGRGVYEKLSLEGGYRMALKISRGHSSHTSLTEELQICTSRQNVARWEVLLAANVVVESIDFYEDARLLFQHCHAEGPAEGELPKVSWQLHLFKGDATNCTATKGLKAHVVSLKSTVRVNAHWNPHEPDHHTDCLRWRFCLLLSRVVCWGVGSLMFGAMVNK